MWKVLCRIGCGFYLFANVKITYEYLQEYRKMIKVNQLKVYSDSYNELLQQLKLINLEELSLNQNKDEVELYILNIKQFYNNIKLLFDEKIFTKKDNLSFMKIIYLQQHINMCRIYDETYNNNDKDLVLYEWMNSFF